MLWTLGEAVHTYDRSTNYNTGKGDNNQDSDNITLFSDNINLLKLKNLVQELIIREWPSQTMSVEELVIKNAKLPGLKGLHRLTIGLGAYTVIGKSKLFISGSLLEKLPWTLTTGR